MLRERERRAFHRAVYWDVEAEFEHDGVAFKARLVRLGDRKVASGQDFDAATGALSAGSRSLWLEDEASAEALMERWTHPWTVSSVEQKPYNRKPYPPFTTSTLQQEAYRKLRFSARHTMRVAQRLYEGIDVDGDERTGLITYMRTDSFHLAQRALAEAQEVIKSRYGTEYTDGPREYKTRTKGAQEAHEAIRPTEIRRHPETLAKVLSADELALYDLIWKRTLASQMSEAKLRRTTIEITASVGAPDAPDTPDAPDDSSDTRPQPAPGVFSASGTTVEFAGFLQVYEEDVDEPSRERDVLLPALVRGDDCDPTAIAAKSHETTPPARYTEASLVKKLEAEGIGRPSTYASVLDTIQRRGYISKRGGSLIPTFTAHAVTQLLELHFADYVDIEFTARMEQALDDIATGELPWKEQLERFYFGDGPDHPGLERQIATQEPIIEYPAMEVGRYPDSDAPIVVRIGRYGPYLQVLGDAEEKISASLPEDLAPADLTEEMALEIIARGLRGSRLLGHDEEGLCVYLAHGRFGPYVQLGETPERGSKEPKPKRASLPKDTDEEAVTLERALVWLSLPRTLGEHPESGEEVIAASGRYGPFLKCGAETRSLPKEDDVYTIGLERALEVLAQPKGRRGRGKAARKVLGTFGKDADGNEIQLLEGFYGPYLTNGRLNAGLPKGADPKALSPEEATRLLAERGKPPKKRGRKK